ncbi:MAG: hypothetical protein ACO4CI_03920 [Phycisphaerales bacterium]
MPQFIAMNTDVHKTPPVDFRTHCRPGSGLRSVAATALVAGLALAQASQATILVSEAFNDTAGDLSGNSGGTGFSGAWSGGGGATGNQVLATSVFEPSDPSARSIQIASNASVTARSLSATYATGGATTYYVSFLFNASPFQGGTGEYAGITLAGPGAGDGLFMGMTGNSGQLGFDWQNRGEGISPATSSTNYLVLVEIKAGVGSTTTVSIFASTDLSMSGTALLGTTPIGLVTNEPNFTFDSVNIAGGYGTGSIQIGRFAIADDANEAAAFSGISAVPGSGGVMLAMLGTTVLGGRRRRRV